jgi:hypothetical protein
MVLRGVAKEVVLEQAIVHLQQTLLPEALDLIIVCRKELAQYRALLFNRKSGVTASADFDLPLSDDILCKELDNCSNASAHSYSIVQRRRQVARHSIYQLAATAIAPKIEVSITSEVELR